MLAGQFIIWTAPPRENRAGVGRGRRPQSDDIQTAAVFTLPRCFGEKTGRVRM
jgi:hypothetical protein